MKGFAYRILFIIVWLLARVLFKIKIIGRENIPKNENFIIISKHRSLWDIPMMALALGFNKRITFVARRGLVLGPLYKLTIPINRKAPERTQIVKIIKAAKEGEILGIFPEGATDPSHQKIRSGVIKIARLANIKILPLDIQIEGPYYRPFFHKDYLKRLRRQTNITLSIKRAISVEELKQLIQSEDDDVLTKILLKADQ